MIVLLSPAKRMDESLLELNQQNLKSASKNNSTIWFESESKKLINQLKKLDEIDLIEMMKISPKIAKLNVNRFQNFATATKKMAIFLFQGDSYRSFEVKSLSYSSIKYAQKHLLILSGLYGLIRPLDLIKPYRLEMGVKLPFFVNQKNNLPDYWKQKLNSKLKELTKSGEIIVNLASKEYSKVLDSSLHSIEVIFKQKRNGQYKTFGILAKKARGLMSRYIIENKIKKVESLKNFNLDSYQFRANLSDKNKLIFTQE